MRGKHTKWLSLILSLVVASSIVSLVSAPVTLPLFYVDPEENVANPCENFTIDINVQDVVDLYSYGIKVRFNRYVLEVTDVTEGPFIKEQTTGTGTAFVAKIYATYIDVGCTTLGLVPGVSGSGSLFNVTFHVKDAGKSDLDMYYSVPLNSTLKQIDHDSASGYFYTTAAADLVRRSAWPEHHHFVVHKDEDFNGTCANQTLFGKVKNLGPVDLYVYIGFELVRDDGFVATVTSDVVVATPGAIVELSGNFELNSTDAGKYAVSARAYYSWSGSYFAEGEKVKTFSFAVVP